MRRPQRLPGPEVRMVQTDGRILREWYQYMLEVDEIGQAMRDLLDNVEGDVGTLFDDLQVAVETILPLLSQSASNVRTANYTLVLDDAGKTICMDVSGANTLTVPPGSEVDFPVGTFINIEQWGEGQTEIVEGSGVTVNSRNGLLMAGQHAMATMRKTDDDEWILGGDVEE